MADTEAAAPAGGPGEATPAGSAHRVIVPVAGALVLLVAYLVTSFVIVGRVHHVRVWETPNDLWDNLQHAQNILVGDYAGIYDSPNLNATPAILLVLLPMQAIVHHFQWTTGFAIPVPRPSAWPYVAPFAVLLCAPVLFGADAVLVRVHAPTGHRLAASLVGALLLINVLWWGHPEDALAVAFVLFAVVEIAGGRWTRAAWLLGIGVAFQSLVVLALPVLLLPAGWRRLPGLAGRTVLPAAMLLLIPFVTDPAATWRAIVEQPVFPDLVRRTPWTPLAPRIPSIDEYRGVTLAGGPTRLVASFIAIAMGVWFMRRWTRTGPAPVAMVWLAAAALSLRYLFDAGVAPYYVWPPVAVAVVVAAVGSPLRLASASVLAVATTWMANFHGSAEWVWWPTSGLLLLTVAVACPRFEGRERSEGAGAGAPDRSEDVRIASGVT